MSYASGKDMLLLPNGATYHLGIKAGDIHPRILTVGASTRAQKIATCLDKDRPVTELKSSRDFLVISGFYKSVGVTIIAIGMGAPMMDFMVRETTFVSPGPMAIIRYGTCGIFNRDLLPGVILTGGKGAMYVQSNYAHFWGSANDETITKDSARYVICNPTPCDATLNKLLIDKLVEQKLQTHDGLNACGETFYSCQGREDERFDDKNSNIVGILLKKGVDFVDMETHQLFHLGQLRKDPCYVAAAAIGIVQRTNESVTSNITAHELETLELNGGRACLEALVAFKL